MRKLLTLLDLVFKNCIVLLFHSRSYLMLFGLFVLYKEKKEKEKSMLGFDATTFILHNLNSAHSFFFFFFFLILLFFFELNNIWFCVLVGLVPVLVCVWMCLAVCVLVCSYICCHLSVYYIVCFKKKSINFYCCFSLILLEL